MCLQLGKAKRGERERGDGLLKVGFSIFRHYHLFPSVDPERLKGSSRGEENAKWEKRHYAAGTGRDRFTGERGGSTRVNEEKHTRTLTPLLVKKKIRKKDKKRERESLFLIFFNFCVIFFLLPHKRGK